MGGDDDGGGYAEYTYLFPGTAIFRIPDTIPDAVATPANCALSTAINAVETIGVNDGETVLIQGAGLLGINLIALVVDAGAKKVFATDVNQSRLDLGTKFGADHCINVGGPEFLSIIHDHTGGYGVDVAYEVCGEKAAISQGVAALRIGGRYLIAGLVTPDSDLGIDGNQITRKCLTLKGIHNYRFDHLGKAIRFIEKYSDKLPYAGLVGRVFSLEEINDAVQVAASGKYVRVAIKNG